MPNLIVADADIAGPPAAGGATLAFVEDWHEPESKDDRAPGLLSASHWAAGAGLAMR